APYGEIRSPIAVEVAGHGLDVALEVAADEPGRGRPEARGGGDRYAGHPVLGGVAEPVGPAITVEISGHDAVAARGGVLERTPEDEVVKRGTGIVEGRVDDQWVGRLLQARIEEAPVALIGDNARRHLHPEPVTVGESPGTEGLVVLDDVHARRRGLD